MSDTASIVTSAATVSIAFSTAAQALVALYGKPNEKNLPEDAHAQIDKIKTSLSGLESVGQYLKEAKELHDHLNRVSLHTSRMKDQYLRALHNRIFMEDDYNIGKVCEIMDDSLRDFVDLNNFLQTEILFVDEAVMKNDKNIYVGPNWSVVLIKQHDIIRELLNKRERGISIKKIDFAEQVNILHAGIINALSLANTKIRKSAENIAEGFLLFNEITSNESV